MEAGWPNKGRMRMERIFGSRANSLDPNNAWKIDPAYQDLDPATGKPLGLMGMVRKYQPDCIVNPRSGWFGDFKTEEGSSTITGPIRSEEAWEKEMTMAPLWGYTPAHADPKQVISTGRVKRMLVDCTIRNMALLLNVSPDRHGKIPEAEQEVLLETGQWLKQTGEAIYGTFAGPWQPKDGQYGYAYKGDTIYLFLLENFRQTTFTLPAVNEGQKLAGARMVDTKKPVTASQNAEREIVLSGFDKPDRQIVIIAIQLNNEVMKKVDSL